LLQLTDQIATLSKTQVEDTLPSIFGALKLDTESGVQAAFALTVIARRPDSRELLRPWLSDVAELLKRSDSRLKATVSVVFQRINPPPVDVAVPVLSAFITSPSYDMQDKVDPLMALVRLAPSEPATESCATYILGSSLDASTRAAALRALGSNQIKSTKIIDLIVSNLLSVDEHVVLASIQSIEQIGLAAVVQAKAALLQLSSDTSRSPAVRRLASNVANGSTEACRTLYGSVPVVCRTP
jgi:hypothetical protein